MVRQLIIGTPIWLIIGAAIVTPFIPLNCDSATSSAMSARSEERDKQRRANQDEYLHTGTVMTDARVKAEKAEKKASEICKSK